MAIQHKQLELDHNVDIFSNTLILNPNGKGPTLKLDAIMMRRAIRAWLMNQEGYLVDPQNMVVASESDNGRTFYMLDTVNACTVPVHSVLMPGNTYSWRPTGGVDRSYFLNESGEGGTLAHSKHSLCLLFHFMDVKVEVPITEKNKAVLDYEVLYCAATPEKRKAMEAERVEQAQQAKAANLFQMLTNRLPVER